jgi:hypothetical protein
VQPLSRLGRQLQEAVACLERAGSDAATYVRGDERVDLLDEILGGIR